MEVPSSYVPCEGCGRTFLPDRLPVHERGCHGIMPQSKLRPTATEYGGRATAAPPNEPTPNAGPKMETQTPSGYVPCEGCGRTFLPDRLPVHERGCHGKKERLGPQSKLRPTATEYGGRATAAPPNEPTPNAGPKMETQTPSGYVPCEGCGRTFLPDRLPVHERGCHGMKERLGPQSKLRPTATEYGGRATAAPPNEPI